MKSWLLFIIRQIGLEIVVGKRSRREATRVEPAFRSEQMSTRWRVMIEPARRTRVEGFTGPNTSRYKQTRDVEAQRTVVDPPNPGPNRPRVDECHSIAPVGISAGRASLPKPSQQALGILYRKRSITNAKGRNAMATSEQVGQVI